LKTLTAYPTLEKQCLRLRDCGFVSGQDAVDINFAHDFWMGKIELQRIAKLEMLDEMEEWRLLASHYCLTWGWTSMNETGESSSDVFEAWRDIKNTHA
jgi:[phosphatase 2A protein]-leucine-carboxy methyltransferase